MRQYSRTARGVRALLGWSAFVVAMAAASLGLAAFEEAVSHPPDVLVKAVPAVITLLVGVPLVLLVHRRDRSPLALAHPEQALAGAMVTVAAVGITFGPAFLAGWISFTAVEPAVLLLFLVTNTLLALAHEAVPEELAFRGSVYGSLRGSGRLKLAAVLTTASFVVAPAAAIALTAAAGQVLGIPTDPATFAPGGQDPVAYAVLLTAFSAVLLLAREATGSLWAAIGVHLTFLTANRILLPSDNFDTGLSVATEPGVELLVLVYLLVAGLGFVVLRRRA
ncbi:CPBP family intramembrane metalloprotease [Kineosporia rhizophila]|uniref:CPBP family intramembrane glutamic endopeptidase n=1 Tax=Kineosporia rhizophila TaxID=84633 RepID=UPI000AD931D2|nr:CPBP family intramembrane glutamic endopeptidase [Kineosporia rhizophila]MCE0534068.1 CPBP family intramembrane metalloprotease [Kineosporia rhizophila]